MVTFAQLIALSEDSLGYITYVFQRLEDGISEASKYIMCVRYPNWNHPKINLGDIGFLSVEEVRAGTDKWYNGKVMVPYRYNAVQFLKFIVKPKEIKHEYTM